MRQLALCAFERPVFADGFAVRNHKQRFDTRQLLLMQMVQLACAKQDTGRGIHHITHILFLRFTAEAGSGNARLPAF